MLGALVFGLNGYRTSVIGILVSVFITMYYIGKISHKIGILFVAMIAVGRLAVGYIASQSIATQHWTLSPIELIFYRAAFTQEVFEKIIPLAGTTHGHILSMIFSSGSPRSFIGNYVLHYDVCLTSTMFGPVMLDFGYIGLTIQMLFNGNVVAASKEAFIVVLQDTGFCNKVMLYQNYARIIEMFSDLGLNIKDHIC